MSSVWKLAALAGGSALFCVAAYKYMKLFEKEYIDETNAINDVLIFMKDEEREENAYLDCDKIKYILNNARSTVDVCMAKLTSTLIIHCLTMVADRGVKVRLVIHSDCSEEDMECHREILDSGGERIIIDPKERLDHEIILVDAHGVAKNPAALVGALSSCYGESNEFYDSTLITSEYKIVSVLQEEFNRLWDSN